MPPQAKPASPVPVPVPVSVSPRLPTAAAQRHAEPASPRAQRSPAHLHAALWRAVQKLATQGTGLDFGPGSGSCIDGSSTADALPSCFTLLDASLPGGGWPSRALTELLLPHPGVGELRLLAPALALLQHAGRSLVWFDPPTPPCAWALGALGINPALVVMVRSRMLLKLRPRDRVPAADVLWALEQTLKSGHAGAVLAWLPTHLPRDALRRLQLAAQHHDGPAFLLREVTARQQPSAAPLRMLLSASGPDTLRLTVFKRRGPPLAQALLLSLPHVLPAPAVQRAAILQASAAAQIQQKVQPKTQRQPQSQPQPQPQPQPQHAG